MDNLVFSHKNNSMLQRPFINFMLYILLLIIILLAGTGLGLGLSSLVQKDEHVIDDICYTTPECIEICTLLEDKVRGSCSHGRSCD